MSPSLNALTGRVIGCAIEVHRALGPGFLESLYGEALTHALSEASARYRRELRVGVSFRGAPIGDHRLDLLVEDQVVVELKAVEQLARVHYAQVRSYLRATDLRVGLLLNFESPTLEVRRILNPDGRVG
ncbi:MAG: GxxExxY protein [Gemmatimonadetes bacterium]|nr:GxxExxY protein [Gemmatimonadota bacterium]